MNSSNSLNSSEANTSNLTDLDSDRNYIIVEKSPSERFVRFVEEIGFGTYKNVYRGYDNDSGCEIAWNVVKLQDLNKEDKMRISTEIEILKNLKHPNIIHFINAWINKSKNEVVFITEIVSGGSLKSYLKKIRQPRLKIIKYWCREILKGLSYLHSHDPPIIHRDIKCENIFINSNKGEIRIGDLGLATFRTSKTKSVLGTPEFMAPEIYEENYGPGCDIYALGMCLLEMATLKTPYSECKNLAQIYQKVTFGIKPEGLNLILNEELKNFINICLKDAKERPTATQLMKEKFLEINDNEDNLPVKIIEGFNIIKETDIMSNEKKLKRDFPDRKFSSKKTRKYSDDRKRKKSIFKDVFIASFHIAERHFTVRFNIFDEILSLSFEKDKKINKDKLRKRLNDSSKNWKQGLLIHFNEILAFVLNKLISIQIKCQTSSQNKIEIDEIKKKSFYNEFSKNYEENLRKNQETFLKSETIEELITRIRKEKLLIDNLHYQQLEKCCKMYDNQFEMKLDGFELENTILNKIKEVQEPIIEEKKISKEDLSLHNKPPLNPTPIEILSKETPEKNKLLILSKHNSNKVTASPLSSTSEGKEKEGQEGISRSITPTTTILEKNLSEKITFNGITLNNNSVSNLNDQTSSKLIHHAPNHKPVIIVPNKGMCSPKNEPNQLGGFKVVSPLVESNKPTAMSILEKRKLNLENLTLGNNSTIILNNSNGNGITSSFNKPSLDSNIINNCNNMVSTSKANNEEEKKNEKTSRLTSPKQIDAVIFLSDNKEKSEIERIIPSNKNITKNFNNMGFFNSIQNFHFMGPLQMNLADMRTDEIKMVQRGLSEVLNKELVDNGHYGHYTERMVKEFQEKFGQKSDGIFTETCWNILKEQIKKKMIDEKTLKMIELEEKKNLQKEIQNKASTEAMTNIENKLRKDPIFD